MQYLKNIKNIIVSKCRNMYFPCSIVVKICILWCISGPFKLLKFQTKVRTDLNTSYKMKPSIKVHSYAGSYERVAQ